MAQIVAVNLEYGSFSSRWISAPRPTGPTAVLQYLTANKMKPVVPVGWGRPKSAQCRVEFHRTLPQLE